MLLQVRVVVRFCAQIVYFCKFVGILISDSQNFFSIIARSSRFTFYSLYSLFTGITRESRSTLERRDSFTTQFTQI